MKKNCGRFCPGRLSSKSAKLNAECSATDRCSAVLQLLEGHKSYMATLRLLIAVFGVLGSVGLVAICHSDDTPLFPRWLLTLTPAFWLILLRGTGALSYIPAPFGLILAGGGFNLVFLVFFCASTAHVVAFEKQLLLRATATAD